MFSVFTRIDTFQIITLQEAKTQLNIVDFNDDDDHIVSLINAAGDMIERYTKQLYGPCTVQSEVDACVSNFFLDFPPLISVESVVFNGDTDLPFTFSLLSGKIKVDTSGLSLDDNYIVSYTAGYATVPEIVKHAAKIIISDLYVNRESQIQDKMTDTTFSALRLLS